MTQLGYSLEALSCSLGAIFAGRSGGSQRKGRLDDYQHDHPARSGDPAYQQSYADFHQHLDRLDQAGLLVRIAEPINKDTEMHPPGGALGMCRAAALPLLDPNHHRLTCGQRFASHVAKPSFTHPADAIFAAVAKSGRCPDQHVERGQ
jgi:hypothetical protein